VKKCENKRLHTSAPCSHWVRGYISVMGTFRGSYLLTKGKMFVFNNLGVSVIGEVFTWCDVNQFEVKLCSALLRVLPVGIGSYLKPILRYKHLILYTYHPDTLYLRTQGCEDPWML